MDLLLIMYITLIVHNFLLFPPQKNTKRQCLSENIFQTGIASFQTFIFSHSRSQKMPRSESEAGHLV